MFLKNEFRPQMAGAGAPNVGWTRKNDSMMFSNGAAESDDFGAFGSEPERRYPPSGSRGRKKGFGGIDFKDKKTIVIAAIAAVVALAIVIGALALLISNLNLSGNVMYEDNAYMCYVDSQDKYHVLANGQIVNVDFDGTVELIPAKDNSFAYVFDHSDDGIYMYVVENKDIRRISDRPVAEILATAGLEVGVVYRSDTEGGSTKYKLYNDKLGTKDCALSTTEPENFQISDDAQTVVYTAKDKSNPDERYMTLYNNDVRERIKKAPAGAIPVAISNDGRYVYNVRTTVDTEDENAVPVPSLFITDIKEQASWDVPNSNNFIAISEMNAKGDEVIFCVGSGTEDIGSINDVIDGGFTDISSSLYRHNAPEENLTTYIGKNIVVSAKPNTEVAIYKTFLDKYLTTVIPDGSDTEKLYTYHLTKKYEVLTLGSTTSNIEGKFSPDGDYFYYVTDTYELKQVELSSGNKKTVYGSGDVSDFAVTEKGNLYILDDGERALCYYKISTGASPWCDGTVDRVSFNPVSNKIYLASEDAENGVWVAEEGTKTSVAKFNDELSALPYFSKSYGKKCYAVVDNGDSISIFYSSNGSRFKTTSATDCVSVVYGVEASEAE